MRNNQVRSVYTDRKSIFEKCRVYWPVIFFILIVGFFFRPFILQGKLPIPSDDLVGLYHPWRDALSQEFPQGYPYKNYLITDPIRQQFPYRSLAIDLVKQGKLPSWNPYAFSGTPLLANIQTAILYPLNVLFGLFSKEIAWSILVFLQPLLAGIFLYLYLRFFGLDVRACVFGSLAFAFSGFMISWMEWNTIGHVALWMPLALLAKEKVLEKWSIRWTLILILAEVSALLGGHLQTALYFLVFINVYLLVRILQKTKWNVQEAFFRAIPFAIKGGVIFLIILPQYGSTFNFILHSARQFDLPDWQRPDWFLPWQHLIQFVVPDFFGNPATGNYWGIWNYGEFVSYIGIIPFVFAWFAMWYRRDRKTFFYTISFAGSLILALPTFIAKLPYLLNVPLLSTLQPSRILFISDFTLAVLAAFGLDYFLQNALPKKRIVPQLVRVTSSLLFVFLMLWIVALFGLHLHLPEVLIANLSVAKKNLILPTTLLVMFSLGIVTYVRSKKREIVSLFCIGLLLVTAFDLLRFAQKFTPFTDRPLLYPKTATIDFIQKNVGPYRFMTTDRKLLPPNVSTYYKLQTVDGYDPLYLLDYGKLVAAWTRNKPDMTPAAFGRILTPEKIDSFFPDLLGVKYIISLKEEKDPKLNLVFQEGETRVYENKQVFPRAFLVSEIVVLDNQEKVIEEMFKNQQKLKNIAYTHAPIFIKPSPLSTTETVELKSYSENEVVVETDTIQERLLVLTDIYYPEWKVFIDGKPSSIFPVNVTLRGVIVPSGKHTILFKI